MRLLNCCDPTQTRILLLVRRGKVMPNIQGAIKQAGNKNEGFLKPLIAL